MNAFTAVLVSCLTYRTNDLVEITVLQYNKPNEKIEDCLRELILTLAVNPVSATWYCGSDECCEDTAQGDMVTRGCKKLSECSGKEL
uniref:Putative ixodegrin protein n=1 Tax=Ixodes ricinus TaxID=34613 RepID=A0A0K8R7J4_IXORI